MAFWNRKNQLPAILPPSGPLPIDLNQALEMVLVSSVKSQAETAAAISKAVTESLTGLAEVQQALFTRRRIRRGAANSVKGAYRGRNGRFSPRSGCRLCLNPMIPNPTVAEIMEHAKHDEVVQASVPESQVQRTPAGQEFVECEDCAKGTPGHSHVIQ